MNEQIVHRGPDDQGFHIDDDCAIGMVRLSIIDLGTGHRIAMRQMVAEELNLGADAVQRIELIEGDTALGYDASGTEISRVPLKEPVHVRAAYDERHQAWRTNVT